MTDNLRNFCLFLNRFLNNLPAIKKRIKLDKKLINKKIELLIIFSFSLISVKMFIIKKIKKTKNNKLFSFLVVKIIPDKNSKKPNKIKSLKLVKKNKLHTRISIKNEVYFINLFSIFLYKIGLS